MTKTLERPEPGTQAQLSEEEVSELTNVLRRALSPGTGRRELPIDEIDEFLEFTADMAIREEVVSSAEELRELLEIAARLYLSHAVAGRVGESLNISLGLSREPYRAAFYRMLRK